MIPARAGVLALTTTLLSCASSNSEPPANSDMVVVGRVVATRPASLMIGDVELRHLIYTLDAVDPKISPVYFIIFGVGTGCPTQFSKTDVYRIALERVRIDYLIDETSEQEKQEHWANLKATNCILVVNQK